MTFFKYFILIKLLITVAFQRSLNHFPSVSLAKVMSCFVILGNYTHIWKSRPKPPKDQFFQTFYFDQIPHYNSFPTSPQPLSECYFSQSYVISCKSLIYNIMAPSCPYMISHSYPGFSRYPCIGALVPTKG